jgi:hypothetical protein
MLSLPLPPPTKPPFNLILLLLLLLLVRNNSTPPTHSQLIPTKHTYNTYIHNLLLLYFYFLTTIFTTILQLQNLLTRRLLLNLLDLLAKLPPCSAVHRRNATLAAKLLILLKRSR